MVRHLENHHLHRTMNLFNNLHPNPKFASNHLKQFLFQLLKFLIFFQTQILFHLLKFLIFLWVQIRFLPHIIFNLLLPFPDFNLSLLLPIPDFHLSPHKSYPHLFPYLDIQAILTIPNSLYFQMFLKHLTILTVPNSLHSQMFLKRLAILPNLKETMVMFFLSIGLQKLNIKVAQEEEFGSETK